MVGDWRRPINNYIEGEKPYLTELTWAARNGRDKIVRFLLQQSGIDVNNDHNDFDYRITPLYWAIEGGH